MLLNPPTNTGESNVRECVGGGGGGGAGKGGWEGVGVRKGRQAGMNIPTQDGTCPSKKCGSAVCVRGRNNNPELWESGAGVGTVCKCCGVQWLGGEEERVADPRKA